MSVRAWSVVAVALLCLAGCGRAGMAPVKGKVTWKGKAVKQAALAFAPVPKSDDDKAPGKPATGFTDADGSYILSTFRAGDGAWIGSHRVTITVDDTNPARCKRQTYAKAEVKADGNEVNFELD